MAQGYTHKIAIPVLISQGGSGSGTGNLSLMNGTSIGTTTNNNAAVGQIGEIVSNSASGVALTTITFTTVCSVSLTPGDWCIWGNVIFVPNASTDISVIVASISLTSNSYTHTDGAYSQVSYTPSPVGGQHALCAGESRISIANTTTVYLIGYGAFGTSTLTVSGYIYARRAR